MNFIDRVDMDEPVRLGFGKVIYEGKHGMVIDETRSDALMIDIDDVDFFIDIYEKNHLEKYQLIQTKQQDIKDILVERYHKIFQFSCYQAVYLRRDKIELILPLGVEIRNLDESYCQEVYQRYHYDFSKDNILNKINKGHLWGLFENQQLAGFIGIHDEGSMGMLEVFEEYRRKGYASLLEKYLICYFMEKGWIPFCQVNIHNQASLLLQQKLGLTISKNECFWLF